MQHRVAFVEPARLRINQVLQGAAGNGGKAMCDTLRADLVHRAGQLWIDERWVSTDGEGFIHRGKPELNSLPGGQRGTNRKSFGERAESILLDLDCVGAVRKLANIEFASGVGFKLRVILISVAGDLHPHLNAMTGGICYPEMQQAVVSLCCKLEHR